VEGSQNRAARAANRNTLHCRESNYKRRSAIENKSIARRVVQLNYKSTDVKETLQSTAAFSRLYWIIRYTSPWTEIKELEDKEKIGLDLNPGILLDTSKYHIYYIGDAILLTFIDDRVAGA